MEALDPVTMLGTDRFSPSSWSMPGAIKTRTLSLWFERGCPLC